MTINEQRLERLAQIIVEVIINTFRDDQSISKLELREIINNRTIDIESGEIKIQIPILNYDKKKYKKTHSIVLLPSDKYQKIFERRQETIQELVKSAISIWKIYYGLDGEEI